MAEPLLNRLLAERADAHRRYNEALTAVDRAIQSMPHWPDPPPPYDEQQLPAINDAWTIIGDGSPARPDGLSGKAFDAVWGSLAPVFQRQMAFNAALVDHLNRNAVAHREARAALTQAITTLRDQFAALVSFESLVVQFLQQITPLTDTHYREIDDAIQQLRSMTNVAQRTAIAAKRDTERTAATTSPSSVTTPSNGPNLATASPQSTESHASNLVYVAFEDQFRGSETEIRERLKDYVPYFDGQSDVLDVGCGRGEFLELLREQGIRARGLDLNAEMVELCRSRGLDATTADARGYLRGVADESLGGMIAVQVIEHLEPSYLAEVLSLAQDKLRPGSRLILETINPACWVAFFESFIRDLSHVKPIHPETLQYLLQASGFSKVEIVFRAPIAEGGKLRRVTPRPEHYGDTTHDPLTELVSSFNANVDRLNGRLFSYQDFAAIATK